MKCLGSTKLHVEALSPRVRRLPLELTSTKGGSSMPWKTPSRKVGDPEPRLSMQAVSSGEAPPISMTDEKASVEAEGRGSAELDSTRQELGNHYSYCPGNFWVFEEYSGPGLSSFSLAGRAYGPVQPLEGVHGPLPLPSVFPRNV